MESIGRIYVDSNVFIALIEGSDELSDALSDLMLSAGDAAARFVTSELTLAEVLVAPLRNGQDHLVDLYDLWTSSSDHVQVEAIGRSVLLNAALLRAQHSHLKLPDAIHISTAIGTGCTHILTGDQRLRERYELTGTRLGIAHGPAGVDILRPDIETLNFLAAAFAP